MNSKENNSGASAAASTSQRTLDDEEEDPLREKRRQLRQFHSRLAQIRHVKAQLEQVSLGQKAALESDQHTSWSVPSAFEMGSVSSEINHGNLLVPLTRAAYIPASISNNQTAGLSDVRSTSIQEDTGQVWVRNRTAESAHDEANDSIVLYRSRDEVPSGYEEMTITDAMARLTQQENATAREAEDLRSDLVKMASKSLEEHLASQAKSITSQNPLTPVDAQGQVVNEEGLPFVDPVEPYVEDSARRSAVPAPLPLQRDSMTKDSRRQWVTSVLDQLEAEEKGNVSKDGDDDDDVDIVVVEEQEVSPKRKEKRPATHRRLSSADRPAPAKSVLKQTGPIPPPLPRFGSSGIRRGFLNLNPSSPAAEHSSDPVDSIDFSKISGVSAARLDRSSSSMGDSLTSAAGSEDSSRDERLSRSVELPSGKVIGQQQKRKKKTVRIQSPVREVSTKKRDDMAWGGPSINGSAAGLAARGAGDEDVEDEAKSILDLLGIDAIKDHPQAGELYHALKEKEKSTQQPAAAPVVAPPALSEAEKPQKPAVSHSVLERSSKSATTANRSGFKRGFLLNPPSGRAATAAVPQAPKVSQGISALERATNSDKGLEDEREKQGLKPTVPHARPSKAFAAKLDAKRRGEDVSRLQKEEEAEEEDSDGPDSGRRGRVRFGDEQGDGKVAVHIGTAATPATSTIGPIDAEEEAQDEGEADDEEEEDRLNSIGMHIREEDLDDDTVEALGYFSDEEVDPDLGWDEDDLELLRPDFSADAEVISNAELRREYERVKASLARHSSRQQASDDLDSFIEGADLELEPSSHDRTTQPKASKFKQDRARRMLQGQTAKSNELGTGHGLDGAKNVGPSMLIPSIANVRFPKANQTMAEGREIELDGGESDEEDLEEMMRQRLSQFHHRDSSDEGRITPVEEASAPPPVVAAQAVPPTSTAPTAPVKKPSLFKSRMNQK